MTETKTDLVKIDPAFVKRAVTFIISSYFLNNVYPTTNEILVYMACPKYKLTEHLDAINEVLQLDERGFDPLSLDLIYYPKLSNELDADFVTAVQVLSNINDKRAKSIKLKEIGMSLSRFQYLYQHPPHRKYYEKVMDKVFYEDTKVEAKRALSANIANGDLQSIKHYHELTHVTENPNQKTLINLGVIIGRLMETLAQYVPKEQLQLIAEDWDKIVDVTAREVEEPNPLKGQLLELTQPNNPLLGEL